MRRVSYLRATANETALQNESDMDQSPMSSMPPGTPDTDETASQSLRRYFSIFQYKILFFFLTFGYGLCLFLKFHTQKFIIKKK